MKPSLFFLKVSYYLSDDVYFSSLEANLTACFSEQCVVPSHADVRAGEEFRSALADND